ncbi:MAG: adenylate/guanylate cyclase domain-containing protein [Verrucomicrobiota bacterium]
MVPEITDARILLVDDVMENIEVAGAILLSKGYKLNVARNGVQALSLLKKTRPDLILLDVSMPEMDGYECCRILKENPETSDIPIIFLTANNQSESIVKGFDVGAVDYVFKPFNSAELLSRIQTHLAIRQSQNRIEELTRQVARYVSPHIFSAIFNGEKTGTLETELKPLTIFFSDIVEFTKRTRTLGDREITQWLNSYLEAMTGIIHKHSATLDKFIGDSVMAFFGDPKSAGVKEDAVAAVLMAIEMNQVTESMGIQVRIGINSGPAFVGNFGAATQMNYTIIGDAVNVASRLQSNSEPGRILISESTYALVKDDFWCEQRGPIHVKGMDQSLMTYWVNG